MNILIVGAGGVGSHLARLLSREKHDITVVDSDQNKINQISESLDVMALVGQGTSPSLLKEARIESADMVIAVTAVDEVNILVCMIAKQHNVKTKIARIRNREFSLEANFSNPELLGIDQIIHPELEATREILRLIRYPQAKEMISYCQGEIQIVGLRIMEGSPLAGKKLYELGSSFNLMSFRLVVIQRNGNTIIPRGKDIIEVDDEVYITCKQENLNEIFLAAGHKEYKTRHVMLYGASAVGRMVAEELEKDRTVHVKLIEQDKDQGWRAAEKLEHASVVIGEASDIDLITREGIIDQDVYAALTEDDEDNIVTSLLARHLRVPKIITLIGKSDYIPIIKTIGLDIAINTRMLTGNAIFKYIHRGEILNLRHMVSLNAETIEFKVSAKSKVVSKKIEEIRFPDGCIVIGVEHKSDVEIPIGSTKLFVGDKVVVFCLPQATQSVMRLFE